MRERKPGRAIQRVLGYASAVSATGDLARYRTISTIGSGGMARVDLAQDTLLGREVALKRIHGEADAAGLMRLRREALVGASVSHPNVVSIYDVVAGDDGHLVIVMEYVPGETLRDALIRGGPMAPTAGLRVLEAVAAGLDAIHARGIVHRDVKPSNILLGADGVVKVADLGIASVPDQTRITTSGAIVGSLSYMAPEQLGDAVATPAIDIYALAAVAYEVLSASKARTAPNAVALAHIIAIQPPPDIRDVWPDAPDGVAEILLAGMARSPADRPRSATDLVRGLREALIGEPTARMAPPPPPPRMPAIVPAPSADVRDLPARDRPTGERGGAGNGHPARRAAVSAAVGAAAGAGPITADGAGAEQRRGGAHVRPRDPRAGEEAVRSPPPRSRSMLAPPPSRRSRTGLLVAGLLGLVVLAIVLAVVLSRGNSANSGGLAASSHRAPRRVVSHRSPPAAAPRSSSSASTTASTSSSASPSASSSSTTAASSSGTAVGTQAGSGAASPASAVQTFYGDAAAHNYQAAWALADPTLRSQLLGYQSFAAGQSGDRSITFHTARVISQSATAASVAVSTTSVRDDGTHQCQGSVDLVKGSAEQWLLHLVHISCT
jgi:serine/threonine protein kinase